MEKCHFEKLVDKVYLYTICFGGYSHDKKFRYAVSEAYREKSYPLNSLCKAEMQGVIKSYLINYGTIGTWIDKRDNRIYFDVSHTYDDLEEALTVARVEKQLAIYDLKDNKEIYL